MMNHFLFLIIILTPTCLPALNNPFSCKRTIIRPPKAQSSLLKNFNFIGLVDAGTQRAAIIQWQGNMHTLQAGATIGPITIKTINAKNIRIITAKEEFILTLKSE